jgi:hypothetical protein
VENMEKLFALYSPDWELAVRLAKLSGQPLAEVAGELAELPALERGGYGSLWGLEPLAPTEGESDAAVTLVHFEVAGLDTSIPRGAAALDWVYESSEKVGPRRWNWRGTIMGQSNMIDPIHKDGWLFELHRLCGQIWVWSAKKQSTLSFYLAGD